MSCVPEPPPCPFLQSVTRIFGRSSPVWGRVSQHTPSVYQPLSVSTTEPAGAGAQPPREDTQQHGGGKGRLLFLRI